jgi:serine/threonine-protein kinase
MGTAAYMSPEQAKGKSVDRRADIWAFGVVLYEMLTGQRAFQGEDNSETLASVLKEMPAFSALPKGTPARLRELMERCLRKDPRLRLRDMGDVKLELDAIGAGGAEHVPAAASPSRPSRAIAAAAMLIVAAIGVAIGWALPHRSAAALSAATRFVVDPPGESDLFSPTLSPDGRFLVFLADGLYKRDLDSFVSTPIPGTEGASSPMISPDGRWVAFFAHGKIKKVSLAGGDPTTIGEANGAMPGAFWGPGDTILFSRGWATGLFALPADGGEVHQVTEPDRKLGERGHWRPRALPGGKRVLFTIWMEGSGVNDARVGLLDLATGQHRALFPGVNATYLQSGHVLYFHAGAWHIVPFDAATGKVTGDPTTVLADALSLSPDGGSSWHPLWVSDNGTLAYLPESFMLKRELVWADRSGTMEPLGLPPHVMIDAALSPDGRRVAVGRIEGGTFELWMDDLERKTEDRLDVKGSNFGAVWYPKGDGIAFVSERKGEYDTYTARPDGGNVQALLTNDVDELPTAWARDGRRLLEKEWRPDGTVPLVLVDTGAGNARQVLIPNVGSGASIKLAPDDRWLLYSSSSSGRSEVYVAPFPAVTPVVRVSSNGGSDPLWSPTGDEFFFRHNQDLVSVSFHEERDRAVIGSEKKLFSLGSSTVFDVALDGRRFLVGRLAEREPPPGIRVVVNWFEELRARASASR